jgi:hypothetical protein
VLAKTLGIDTIVLTARSNRQLVDHGQAKDGATTTSWDLDLVGIVNE